MPQRKRVRVKDDIDGSLTLHEICKNSTVTAKFLVDTSVDATKEKDRSVCLPLHFICANK